MTTPSTISTTDAVPSQPLVHPDSQRPPLKTRLVSWRARTHPLLLFLYYLAILAGLLLIYSRGNFATPTFIYQGF